MPSGNMARREHFSTVGKSTQEDRRVQHLHRKNEERMDLTTVLSSVTLKLGSCNNKNTPFYTNMFCKAP